MDGDEILSTDLWIAQLMDVGYCRAGYFTGLTLLTILVCKAAFFCKGEVRFPEHTPMNPDDSVRAVVIMDRRFLARAPAKYQHLNRVIATNPVSPIVAFLETQKGKKIVVGNVRDPEPGADFFKLRGSRLIFEMLHQSLKG